MKKILALITLFSASAAVAAPQDFQSGSQFQCFDSVSLLEWRLRIDDIGDEEGSVQVVKNGRQIAQMSAHVEENGAGGGYKAGIRFMMFQNGRVTHTIVFDQWDLKSAYYMDGGDSRAMKCRRVR